MSTPDRPTDSDPNRASDPNRGSGGVRGLLNDLLHGRDDASRADDGRPGDDRTAAQGDARTEAMPGGAAQQGQPIPGAPGYRDPAAGSAYGAPATGPGSAPSGPADPGRHADAPAPGTERAPAHALGSPNPGQQVPGGQPVPGGQAGSSPSSELFQDRVGQDRTGEGRTEQVPAGTGPGAGPRDAAADQHGTAQPTGRERLVPAARAQEFASRWDAVKGEFVDEPRQAVRQADALVGELLDELTTLFRDQRQGLEHGLDTDDTSTEDLRLALRRYRSFFDRLLSL